MSETLRESAAALVRHLRENNYGFPCTSHRDCSKHYLCEAVKAVEAALSETAESDPRVEQKAIAAALRYDVLRDNPLAESLALYSRDEIADYLYEQGLRLRPSETAVSPKGPEVWRVKSGDLDVDVLGATPFEAVVNAIKEHKPAALGEIATVVGEECYVSTERALRAAGLWAEEPKVEESRP